MAFLASVARLGCLTLIGAMLSGCLTDTPPGASPSVTRDSQQASGTRETARSLLAQSAARDLTDPSPRQNRIYAENAETASALFASIDDNAGRSAAAQNAGRAHQALGEYDKATAFYQQAADAGGRSGCLPCIASAEQGLGDTSRLLGKRDEARAHFSRAASLFELADQGLSAAANWDMLGRLNLVWRDLDAAGIAFDRAENLYRTHGDPEYQARAIAGKADVALRSGRIESASTELQRALAIQKTLKFRNSEIGSLAALSRVAHLQGDDDRAVAYLTEASAAVERETAVNLRGNDFYKIAVGYRQLGRIDGARVNFENARGAFQNLKLHLGQAATEIALAEIAYDGQDFTAVRQQVLAVRQSLALSNARESLAVALNIVPLPRWQCTALQFVLEGSLREHDGDTATAIVLYDKAMAAFHANGATLDVARVQMLKGLSLVSIGNLTGARAVLVEARDGFRASGDARKVGEVDAILQKIDKAA